MSRSPKLIKNKGSRQGYASQLNLNRALNLRTQGINHHLHKDRNDGHIRDSIRDVLTPIDTDDIAATGQALGPQAIKSLVSSEQNLLNQDLQAANQITEQLDKQIKRI